MKSFVLSRFTLFIFAAFVVFAMSAQAEHLVRTIGCPTCHYETVTEALEELKSINDSPALQDDTITFEIQSGIYEFDESLVLEKLPRNQGIIFMNGREQKVDWVFTLKNPIDGGVIIRNSEKIVFASDETGHFRISARSDLSTPNSEIQTFRIEGGSRNIWIEGLDIRNQSPLLNSYSMPVFIGNYFDKTIAPIRNIQISHCHIQGSSTYGIFADADAQAPAESIRIADNAITGFKKFGIYLFKNLIQTTVHSNVIYQTVGSHTSVYGIRSASSGSLKTVIQNNIILGLIPGEQAGVRGIFLPKESVQTLVQENQIYLEPKPNSNVSYGIFEGTNPRVDSVKNNVFIKNKVVITGTDNRGSRSYAFFSASTSGKNYLVGNHFENKRNSTAQASQYSAAFQHKNFRLIHENQFLQSAENYTGFHSRVDEIDFENEARLDEYLKTKN